MVQPMATGKRQNEKIVKQQRHTAQQHSANSSVDQLTKINFCLSIVKRQLKGSVKEPNISIYFFYRPSLNGVLFSMFCLLVKG